MNSTKTNKNRIISIAALLISAVMIALIPLAVLGKKSTKDADYRFYSVKRGDTLSGIAQSYGVTASEIAKLNNVKDVNRIYRGQILKVPVSSSGEGGALVSTYLSLNLVDADVRDVLSAIAINANYTVIYSGKVENKITVNFKDYTPLKAVDYITRLCGITYLKDGSTLFVGTASELNSTFIDKTVLTKYHLKYITPAYLQSQAAAVGLSDVTYLSTAEDTHNVWVTAYPKEMAKLMELIKILDVSRNITPGSDMVVDNFTQLDFKYIQASEFNSLLASLGLRQGLVIGSRPYSMFVYVTGEQLRDIQTIKRVVDKPLSGMNLTASEAKPDSQNNSSNNENTTGANTESTTKKAETVNDLALSSQITLNNITTAEAQNIVSSLGLTSIKFYTNSRFTKSFWLLGTAEDISKAKEAVQNVDTATPAITESFTAITLKNLTAAEMISRVGNVSQLTGVSYSSMANPSTSHVLYIYTTQDMMETAKTVIAKIDAMAGDSANGSTSEVRWTPIINNLKSDADGQKIVNVLRTTYPEMNSVNFKTMELGTTNFVLLANTTQDKAEYIKSLVAALGA
ncbi:MAG: LysM peptidoglycan-binding domain-containing protein [Candidatus Fimenecus sp.]